MTQNDVSETQIAAQLAKLGDLRAAIGQAIVGQEAVVEQLLIALIAGG
ncbi:MAG: AAA family ATPase, partial [Lysobacteraceae bacterium]